MPMTGVWQLDPEALRDENRRLQERIAALEAALRQSWHHHMRGETLFYCAVCGRLAELFDTSKAGVGHETNCIVPTLGED